MPRYESSGRSVLPGHKSQPANPSILVIKTYVMAGRCLTTVAAARFMTGVVRRVAVHWGCFPYPQSPFHCRRSGHRTTGWLHKTAIQLTTILLLRSFQSTRTIVYICIWTQHIDHFYYFHLALIPAVNFSSLSQTCWIAIFVNCLCCFILFNELRTSKHISSALAQNFRTSGKKDLK